MSFTVKETVCASIALLACAGIALEFGYLKPKRTKSEITTILKEIRRINSKNGVNNISEHNYKDTAIVIAAYSFDLNLYISVNGLRYLGCNLPIVIISKEIPTEYHINQFNELNASIVYRNVDALKLVAVLESTYAEIILLDADIFLLQNPTNLLDNSSYVSTGLLMWNASPLSRSTIFTGGGAIAKWIRALIPYTRRENVILNGSGTAQASSSILIINKLKHPGLLAILRKFVNIWTDVSFDSKVGIEDELFWVSSELAKEEYSFVGKIPGTIGYRFGNGVRGITLHFDEYMQLLAIHDENGKLFDEYRTTDFSVWNDGYSSESKSLPLYVKDIINWYYTIYSNYILSTRIE